MFGSTIGSIIGILCLVGLCVVMLMVIAQVAKDRRS